MWVDIQRQPRMLWVDVGNNNLHSHRRKANRMVPNVGMNNNAKATGRLSSVQDYA